MLGNRLLYESDLTTPLGRVHLIGTASGPSRIRDRVMREYAWVYSVAGVADYSDELGTRQPLHPGDGVIIFPGVRHSYGAVAGEVWDQVYFVFDGTVFNLLESSGLLDRSSPIMGLEPVEEWLGRYLRFADRPQPIIEAEAMIVVGDFVQLLVSSLAQSSRQHSWLSRARELMDGDISRPLDLKWVAGELGISYETFRKRFRTETGEPPAQYRARRRIATAAELLRSTSLSLREIAVTLGYSDAYHLSKRFKAAIGLSPREYRRGGDRRPR